MATLRIDAGGKGPLHERIAASVRAALRAGEYAPGDRLPAARDLADGLGVNINTVLRAYRDLHGEGVIDLRRGRGAVVREGAIDTAHLDTMADQLAAEALRLGLSIDQLTSMLTERMHHDHP